MSSVRTIAAAGCELGEGPVWRADQQALLFTDIIGRAVLRWSAEHGLRRIDLGRRLGAFAPSADGDALLAVSEREIAKLRLDFEAGSARWESLGHADAIPADQIMNDGCCDARGRFVFGAKALNETDPVAAMMRYGAGALIRLRDGIVIFNGPAFAPAGDRIYWADSPTKRIMTASYDLESGEITQAELFVELPADAGYPDGMTVDAEGGLWNAQWDGWRIARYRPDGTLDREIETPVSRPTSLAFGGAEGRTLFITSARRGTDEMAPATEPGAGDLFAVDLDVAGAPVWPFAA